jgi:hypothetical protein
MVKKKKSSSANKKLVKTFATKLKKSKLYRHKYLVAVGLLVIVLLSGWSFSQPKI